MSVLINGMKMPTDYSVIVKIFPDGRVGAIHTIQWFKVDLIPGTQAVPVPLHGRLIDADALYTHIKDEQRKRNYPYDGWSECQVALGFVNTAPTILEAEEGEA